MEDNGLKLSLVHCYGCKWVVEVCQEGLRCLGGPLFVLASYFNSQSFFGATERCIKCWYCHRLPLFDLVHHQEQDGFKLTGGWGEEVASFSSL